VKKKLDYFEVVASWSVTAFFFQAVPACGENIRMTGLKKKKGLSPEPRNDET
jgi:hypothetical protein